MYFWFKLFFLTLVLENGAKTTQSVRFTFDHITLGHSGLLISWKPNMKPNKNTPITFFKFATRIKDAIHMNDNFSVSEYYTESSKNQYKISLLKENTLYDVIIRQYSKISNESSDIEIEYPLVLKTNWKTNKKPVKPKFTCYLRGRNNNKIYIQWLPCGEERNCDGNEAGTHFAVKFRVLDRRGEYRFEQHFSDTMDLILFTAGIQYEAILISINGNHETESDPQEIFLNPLFSTVTSVKVTSFFNASILVSWKPPKYALKTLTQYILDIANYTFAFNNPLIVYGVEENVLRLFEDKNATLTNTTEQLFDHQKYQLKPGETYIITITPAGKLFGGMETRVKYTIPIKKDEL